MKRNFLAAALAVSVMVAAGCQTVQHATPSGKAETTIANVAADQVKGEIVNGMMTAGYVIQQDTSYALSFDKPVQNFGAALLYGSQYDGVPNSRVTFAIAQIGTGVRIVSDVAVVTNPGSAFERRNPTNNSADGAHVQAMLDSLKSKLNPSASQVALEKKNIYFGASAVSLLRAQQVGQKCPGQAPTQPGLCLVDVGAASPAAAAGLKKGDVLIAINNRQMLVEPDFVDTLATLSSGMSVPVTYLRKGQSSSTTVLIGQRPAGV